MKLADLQLKRIGNNKNNMNKTHMKVIVGGPLGILAWSASAGTMLIIFIWGLEKSALAVVAVKTVSWGMWGAGVIRESSYYKLLKDKRRLIKDIRKSPFHLSWGLIFYLSSMGEQKRLNYNLFPVSLRLHREYYIPVQRDASEFTYTYFYLPEGLIMGRQMAASQSVRDAA